jgi:hypothetical protein
MRFLVLDIISHLQSALIYDIRVHWCSFVVEGAV